MLRHFEELVRFLSACDGCDNAQRLVQLLKENETLIKAEFRALSFAREAVHVIWKETRNIMSKNSFMESMKKLAEAKKILESSDQNVLIALGERLESSILIEEASLINHEFFVRQKVLLVTTAAITKYCSLMKAETNQNLHDWPMPVFRPSNTLVESSFGLLKSLEHQLPGLKTWRTNALTQAKMNKLHLFLTKISDEDLRNALKSRREFDALSIITNEIQTQLSFEAHERRQEDNRLRFEKIDEIAEAIFLGGLINEELIINEDMDRIHSLFPVISQQLREQGITRFGKTQYLLAILQSLKITEMSYVEIDERNYAAKSKNFVCELIERSLNRLSKLIK